MSPASPPPRDGDDDGYQCLGSLVEQLEGKGYMLNASDLGRIHGELLALGNHPSSTLAESTADLFGRLGHQLAKFTDGQQQEIVSALAPLREDIHRRMSATTKVLNTWLAEMVPPEGIATSSPNMDHCQEAAFVERLKILLEKVACAPQLQYYRRCGDAKTRVRFLVAVASAIRAVQESSVLSVQGEQQVIPVALIQRLTNCFFVLPKHGNVLSIWIDSRLDRYNLTWWRAAQRAVERCKDGIQSKLLRVLQDTARRACATDERPWFRLSRWPMAWCPLARAFISFMMENSRELGDLGRICLSECPAHSLRPQTLFDVIRLFGTFFEVDATTLPGAVRPSPMAGTNNSTDAIAVVATQHEAAGDDLEKKCAVVEPEQVQEQLGRVSTATDLKAQSAQPLQGHQLAPHDMAPTTKAPMPLQEAPVTLTPQTQAPAPVRETCDAPTDTTHGKSDERCGTIAADSARAPEASNTNNCMEPPAPSVTPPVAEQSNEIPPASLHLDQVMHQHSIARNTSSFQSMNMTKPKAPSVVVSSDVNIQRSQASKPLALGFDDPTWTVRPPVQQSPFAGAMGNDACASVQANAMGELGSAPKLVRRRIDWQDLELLERLVRAGLPVDDEWQSQWKAHCDQKQVLPDFTIHPGKHVLTEFVERNLYALFSKEWAKDLMYKAEGLDDKVPTQTAPPAEESGQVPNEHLPPTAASSEQNTYQAEINKDKPGVNEVVVSSEKRNRQRSSSRGSNHGVAADASQLKAEPKTGMTKTANTGLSNEEEPSDDGSRGDLSVLPSPYHKTRLCLPFLEGKCTKGRDCSFAHSQQELKQPGEAKQEAQDRLDRKLRKESKKQKTEVGEAAVQPRVDPYFKTHMCPFWMQQGHCPHSTNCYYAHSPDEVRNFPSHMMGLPMMAPLAIVGSPLMPPHMNMLGGPGSSGVAPDRRMKRKDGKEGKHKKHKDKGKDGKKERNKDEKHEKKEKTEKNTQHDKTERNEGTEPSERNEKSEKRMEKAKDKKKKRSREERNIDMEVQQQDTEEQVSAPPQESGSHGKKHREKRDRDGPR
eukprot:CAMPEP_0172662490 /NCGR_PEP_ID=MMETSP1074-20121228/5391_1 /TAXON_ID=2916 /ORGANISM="Ceratium fusus, Strain PA161109" /LENGTH=1049 /DNA_ID=CAMNT_0013478411 /DNA_START=6 /DNA_END=3152 /DNA_ORIENTATION=-